GAMAAAAWYASWHGASWVMMLAAALLVFLPASDLVTGLVQRLVAYLVRPRRLVRFDLANGLIPGTRTMVVVPTMLDSVERAHAMVAHLEVQALANPDPLLHFALLTDCCDAAQEVLPDDDVIVATARAGIEELNRRHGEG